MKIRITEIVPKVFQVAFDTQYDLCMTFVRLQEYYESPEFKGKHFTLEEYMDWWSEHYGHGSFDYPSRWSGFNVPGKVYYNWQDLFRELRPKEKILVEALNKRIIKKGYDFHDVYVIGCYKGKRKKEVVRHELAHAMYALYPDYQESCDKLIAEFKEDDEGLDAYGFAHNSLIRMGYCDDVIEDEVQAYFSTNDNEFGTLICREQFVKHYEEFKEKLKNDNN